ncbi:MAG TPA: RusA family crossover junction endodeoxyribonuclease [Verrucomicrobiae bacterium]|jgi:Holliday junction resolvase RusA-like endonuclease|nr:RusA family crossover junction endodeoxyribonuclease [Verrucomicrobiae bacterium]
MMPTEALTFTVGGTPRPQQRPRKVRGRWVSTTNPKLQLWRAAIERACKAALANRGDPLPLFGRGVAVSVSLRFRFAAPAGAPERIGTDHTHKPDKDNLEKAVLDVLEMCGVFANDSQVSRGPVEKIWGARSGLSVEIAPAVARNVPPERDALVGGLPGWLD